MPDLFRVSPMIEGAPDHEPGGALYVPRHRQGSGRVDNPEHYGTFYAAASPVAAVAERLQGFRGLKLSPVDLRVPGPTRRRVPLAITRYETLDDHDRDLDHPRALEEHDLIPSDIATRDRAVTQGWALRIWREQRWRGVRFWSSLEAKWPVIARWTVDDLRVREVETLTMFHPAVRQAADFLAIEIGR